MAHKKAVHALHHPRYWPTWIGVALLRILSLLPLSLLNLLGTGVGLLTWRVFGSRRRIAETNIRLCFPELDDARRRLLVRSHFVQLGRSILTMGINWFAPAARLDRLFRIEGCEHIDRIIERGENVILLAPHFVALEIGGIYISRRYPTISMYQFIKNPVMDRVIRNGRQRFAAELVERKDAMHQLIRRIRAGRVFYYLPDQDPGPRKGIFVPFFGVDAATFPMLSRFARMSRARVVPCMTEQLEGGRGWRVRLLPPLEDFPGDDETVDTRRMNEAVEETVRIAPAQYFWVHKRFKTRPPGAPRVYQD
jgi:Kdo2-lipid IVA lauroyltransferase/acyltransferase